MNQKVNQVKKTTTESGTENEVINHFANIVKQGEADKLAPTAKGKVIYEIALHDEEKQLYFRIAGQTIKGGLHSKQWIPLTQLLELIEEQEDKAWKSNIYKSLFSGGSINNHSFCASIARELGLAQKSESSIYLHVVGEKYRDRKKELLALSKSRAK
ncbi:hypothetical protein [Vibrio kanaloae]|uniref:Uncharacterized protein n=1 Tax=Vibrio kanaloae TaxID=170673 RepID=A0A4U1YYF8_9VIBR|nr:hypothetical protein [Vibrio kanaloae]TKF25121.1 hypothetical protein FCV52_13225 [Vibrio kanaloae]